MWLRVRVPLRVGRARRCLRGELTMGNLVCFCSRFPYERRLKLPFPLQGYDKSAQPVQIIPRKVTKVTKPVIAISITVETTISTTITLPNLTSP